MKLRKPCEHGRYDDHRWWDADGSVFTCPGGEFLAADARLLHGLVRVWNPDLNDYACMKFAQEIIDALTVREGAG